MGKAFQMGGKDCRQKEKGAAKEAGRPFRRLMQTSRQEMMF